MLERERRKEVETIWKETRRNTTLPFLYRLHFLFECKTKICYNGHRKIFKNTHAQNMMLVTVKRSSTRIREKKKKRKKDERKKKDVEKRVNRRLAWRERERDMYGGCDCGTQRYLKL